MLSLCACLALGHAQRLSVEPENIFIFEATDLVCIDAHHLCMLSAEVDLTEHSQSYA